LQYVLAETQLGADDRPDRPRCYSPGYRNLRGDVRGLSGLDIRAPDPRGNNGAQLRSVEDVLHIGMLTLIRLTTPMQDGVVTIIAKRLSMATFINEADELARVIAPIGAVQITISPSHLRLLRCPEWRCLDPHIGAAWRTPICFSAKPHAPSKGGYVEKGAHHSLILDPTRNPVFWRLLENTHRTWVTPFIDIICIGLPEHSGPHRGDGMRTVDAHERGRVMLRE
jgi:hypothetical protein